MLVPLMIYLRKRAIVRFLWTTLHEYVISIVIVTITGSRIIVSIINHVLFTELLIFECDVAYRRLD